MTYIKPGPLAAAPALAVAATTPKITLRSVALFTCVVYITDNAYGKKYPHFTLFLAGSSMEAILGAPQVVATAE